MSCFFSQQPASFSVGDYYAVNSRTYFRRVFHINQGLQACKNTLNIHKILLN